MSGSDTSIASAKPKQRPGFQKGVSGNPAGRKKGVRHKFLVALDCLGQENVAEIVQTVIQAAKAADMRAAELILARAWPAPKGRLVTFEMPATKTAADLPGAFDAVIAAVAEGELTPDEAASIAALLETQRRAIETADLEQRIATLESRHAPQT